MLPLKQREKRQQCSVQVVDARSTREDQVLLRDAEKVDGALDIGDYQIV